MKTINVVEPIVTQHAEDTAFLWLLRDSAVNEPHYKLSDLSKLDNRLEAHIDDSAKRTRSAIGYK